MKKVTMMNDNLLQISHNCPEISVVVLDQILCGVAGYLQ